ncbi:uncharacterized protein LOC125500094 [Athalia rosae]|uniref:uncharacterized protein LOC125500094 n=1 Tax=Athalia rosae TaxID=37344 RepID=UPI00203406BD|nr:uncharacterized protein LOC125500094 [Athalia rosae]
MQTSMATYLDERRFRFSWKSQGALLVAVAVTHLEDQLNRLKNTRWWNSKSRFLLINQYSAPGEDCTNAYDFLSLAWKHGLLSTIFMCKEQDNTPAVYSYNPFGSTAPQPWVMVREVKGLQGHPWNLFKIEKFDGRRIACRKVYFDKTKSLGGYPIFVSGNEIPPLLSIRTDETNMAARYSGEDGWLMITIWSFLNASMVDVGTGNNGDNTIAGWIGQNGTFYGNMIDIASGKLDIALNSMILGPIWKVTTTYPHTSLNVCFVTKDRGYVPWLIALSMVFDVWTLACGVFVIFMGVIIFGYFDRRRYSLALLNMLRVSYNSAYLRPPPRIPLRIILFFVLLVPLIFNSTIQGKILSLIKNPLRSQNIEDIRDLPAEYVVQGPVIFKEYSGTVIGDGDRFVTSTLEECLGDIYRDKHTACTHYCQTLVVRALHMKRLHLASVRSPDFISRFVAKPDWSLIERFDTLLLRLVESGCVLFYGEKSLYDNVKSVLPMIRSESNDAFTVTDIDLDDIHYVFWLIGIGWILAILAFVIELLVHRKKVVRVSNPRIIPAAKNSRTSNLINPANFTR